MIATVVMGMYLFISISLLPLCRLVRIFWEPPPPSLLSLLFRQCFSLVLLIRFSTLISLCHIYLQLLITDIFTLRGSNGYSNGGAGGAMAPTVTTLTEAAVAAIAWVASVPVCRSRNGT